MDVTHQRGTGPHNLSRRHGEAGASPLGPVASSTGPDTAPQLVYDGAPPIDNAGSQPPNIPNSYVGPSAASNPKHHQPQSKIKIKEINIKIKEGIKIKNKK